MATFSGATGARASMLVARDEFELNMPANMNGAGGSCSAINGFGGDGNGIAGCAFASSNSSSTTSSSAACASWQNHQRPHFGSVGGGGGGGGAEHQQQQRMDGNGSGGGDGPLSTLRRSLRQINPFKGGTRFFRLPATPRLSRSKKVLGRGEDFTSWNFERPQTGNGGNGNNVRRTSGGSGAYDPFGHYPHQANGGIGGGGGSLHGAPQSLTSASSFGAHDIFGDWRQQQPATPFNGGGQQRHNGSDYAARRFSQQLLALDEPSPEQFQSSPMMLRRRRQQQQQQQFQQQQQQQQFAAPLAGADEDEFGFDHVPNMHGSNGRTARGGAEGSGIDDLDEFLNAMESISRRGQIVMGGGSCRLQPTTTAMATQKLNGTVAGGPPPMGGTAFGNGGGRLQPVSSVAPQHPTTMGIMSAAAAAKKRVRPPIPFFPRNGCPPPPPPPLQAQNATAVNSNGNAYGLITNGNGGPPLAFAGVPNRHLSSNHHSPSYLNGHHHQQQQQQLLHCSFPFVEEEEVDETGGGGGQIEEEEDKYRFLPSTCYGPNGEMYAARWRPGQQLLMAQQQQLAQINRSGDGGDSGSGASPRMAQRGAHLGAATNRHQRPQAMHWSEQQQPHQQQQQSLKSPSHSTITLLNTMQQLHQQHSSSFVGGVGATNGRSASSVSTRQKQQFQMQQTRAQQPTTTTINNGISNCNNNNGGNSTSAAAALLMFPQTQLQLQRRRSVGVGGSASPANNNGNGNIKAKRKSSRDRSQTDQLEEKIGGGGIDEENGGGQLTATVASYYGRDVLRLMGLDGGGGGFGNGGGGRKATTNGQKNKKKKKQQKKEKQSPKATNGGEAPLNSNSDTAISTSTSPPLNHSSSTGTSASASSSSTSGLLLCLPPELFPLEDELQQFDGSQHPNVAENNGSSTEVPCRHHHDNFIGREWLFKELCQQLITEKAQLVLLHGGPGSGKSAVLRHLLVHSVLYLSTIGRKRNAAQILAVDVQQQQMAPSQQRNNNSTSPQFLPTITAALSPPSPLEDAHQQQQNAHQHNTVDSGIAVCTVSSSSGGIASGSQLSLLNVCNNNGGCSGTTGCATDASMPSSATMASACCCCQCCCCRCVSPTPSMGGGGGWRRSRTVGAEQWVGTLGAYACAFHFAHLHTANSCSIPEFVRSVCAQLCQCPALRHSYGKMIRSDAALHRLATQECAALAVEPLELFRLLVLNPIGQLYAGGGGTAQHSEDEEKRARNGIRNGGSGGNRAQRRGRSASSSKGGSDYGGSNYGSTDLPGAADTHQYAFPPPAPSNAIITDHHHHQQHQHHHSTISSTVSCNSAIAAALPPFILICVDALDEAGFHRTDGGESIGWLLRRALPDCPPQLRFLCTTLALGAGQTLAEQTAIFGTLAEGEKGMEARSIRLDDWELDERVATDARMFVEAHVHNNPTLNKWVTAQFRRQSFFASAAAASPPPPPAASFVALSAQQQQANLCDFAAQLVHRLRANFAALQLALNMLAEGRLHSLGTMPTDIGQLYAMYFHHKFPMPQNFQPLSSLLSIMFASLRPLCFDELLQTLNATTCVTGSEPDTLLLTATDLRAHVAQLAPFIRERPISGHIVPWHCTLRDWLLKEETTTEFAIDVRNGHILLALSLMNSLRQQQQQPQQNSGTTAQDLLFELAHHLLKANPHKYMQPELATRLRMPQARDAQVQWLRLAMAAMNKNNGQKQLEEVNGALLCRRNVFYPNAKVARLLLLAGADPNTSSWPDCTEEEAQEQQQQQQQQPLLCEYARAGNTEMVQLLLQFGANPNCGNPPPMILAIQRGHEQVARVLHAKGAHLVGVSDAHGRGPLWHAAANDSLAMLSFLLDAIGGGDGGGGGAHSVGNKQHNMKGGEAMEAAANCNDLGIINNSTQQLAQTTPRRYSICSTIIATIGDEENCNNNSPLNAQNGSIDMNGIGTPPPARLMPISKNEAIREAFEVAAERGSVRVCRFLLDCTDAVLDTSRAMCIACANGRSEVVQFLLSRGATLAPDQMWNGKSALVCAVESGSWDLVVNVLNGPMALQQLNAMSGPDRLTPLMVAARHGHVGLVDLLANRGAHLDAADVHGRTAAMYAIEAGHTSTVGLLLERGCNPLARDKHGNTMLHLLARHPSKCLINRLLEAGQLSLEDKNRTELRPLEVAIQCGELLAVDTFLRRGARLRTLTWQIALRSHPPLVLVLLRKLLDDAQILLRRKRTTEAQHRFSYALQKCDELLLAREAMDNIGDEMGRKLVEQQQMAGNGGSAKATKEVMAFGAIRLQLKRYKVQALHSLAILKRRANDIGEALTLASQALDVLNSGGEEETEEVEAEKQEGEEETDDGTEDEEEEEAEAMEEREQAEYRHRDQCFELHLLRAKCHFDARDLERARVDAQLAACLRPGNQEAHSLLAVLNMG